MTERKSSVKYVPAFFLMLLVATGPVFSAEAEVSTAQLYKEASADWERGDIVGAMPKLRRAADLGHAESQALYAYFLDQADDDEEAAKYYRLAAAQNNVDGIYGIAAFHVSGDGKVERSLTTAKDLFIRAADLGHAPSVSVVALAYLQGGLGLSDEERASKAALDWIQKAANGGMVQSMDRLALVFEKGEFGVAPDLAKSAEWKKKSMDARGIKADEKPKRRRK